MLTAWNLNIQTVHNPDEPRYAVPARIMLEKNTVESWMVPEFNTKPRLQKPILFYWLIAATGAIGQALGINVVLAMRFGPLLMGLLGVIGTFLLGRKLFGARCGFMAALVLMTAKFYHDISRELVVDMTLTAFCVWSWVFVVDALEKIRGRYFFPGDRAEGRAPTGSAFFPLLGFYLCMGLACMTKGPALVALFVVAPLLVMLWRSDRLGDLKRAGLLWGVPFSIVIGFAWFIAMQISGHDILGVLKRENLARAVGGKDHQQYIPCWFYVNNMFENFAPWCVLLPFAAWWTVRYLRRGPSDKSQVGVRAKKKLSDSEMLLACGLGVSFLLLGLIVSKRALYLLPLYPFLSLWIAWYWENAFLAREGERCGKAWSAGFTIAGIAVIAGITVAFRHRDELLMSGNEMPLLLILGVSIAGALYLISKSLERGQRMQACLQILAVASVLCIGYEAVFRPIRERDADSVLFYKKVSERLQGRQLVMMGDSSNEAVWFLDRPNELVDDIRYPDLKARFFDAKEVVLLMKDKEMQSTPKLAEALALEGVIERGDERWVLATPNKYVTPDPAIFVPKSKRTAKGED